MKNEDLTTFKSRRFEFSPLIDITCVAEVERFPECEVFSRLWALGTWKTIGDVQRTFCNDRTKSSNNCKVSGKAEKRIRFLEMEIHKHLHFSL